MRAIVIEKETLVLRERPAPEPGKGEVRVRIHATAINRADVLQRRGLYAAPPDAPSDIPGLELAGEVDALGPGVTELAVGDRVYGIVGGGSYAEQVVVHARALAKMPAHLDFVNAAAIPEAFITAYDSMVLQAGLTAGETVLIHAAGSGVGTAAIQIAKAIGAIPIGTARTQDKLDRAALLGLTKGLVPKDGKFADEMKCDVVLDLVGGSYVAESIRALRLKGRLVCVGLVGGAKSDLDLAQLLHKRLTVRGTVLRARPLEEKIAAAQVLQKSLSPLFEAGALKPIVAEVFPLDQAPRAHERMENNDAFGKLVLSL